MKDIQFVKILFVIIAGIFIVSAAADKKNPLFTVDDEQLQEAVSSVLNEDDAVADHYIDITVKEGVVFLQGTVANILARDRAEMLVPSLVRNSHSTFLINFVNILTFFGLLLFFDYYGTFHTFGIVYWIRGFALQEMFSLSFPEWLQVC